MERKSGAGSCSFVKHILHKQADAFRISNAKRLYGAGGWYTNLECKAAIWRGRMIYESRMQPGCMARADDIRPYKERGRYDGFTTTEENSNRWI